MPEAPVPKLMEYVEGCGAIWAFFKLYGGSRVTSGIYAEKNEGTLVRLTRPRLFMGDKRYVGARELQERGENDIRRVLDCQSCHFGAARASGGTDAETADGCSGEVNDET